MLTCFKLKSQDFFSKTKRYYMKHLLVCFDLQRKIQPETESIGEHLSVDSTHHVFTA